MPGGYGYEVRSYNNTFGGVAPPPPPPPVAQKWKKSEYAESDHVALQQPYIPTTESYVVKSERIIEKVQTPPTVIEYSRISPVNYGVERNRRSSTVPTSVDDRPRKVEEFITQVQTEVSQPHLSRTSPGLLNPRAKPDYNNHGGYPSNEYGQQASDSWSRSSSPVQGPAAEYKHSYNPSEYGGQNTTRGSITRPSSQASETEQKRSSSRPGYLGHTSLAPPVAEYTHGSNSPPRNHTTENNPWVRNAPQQNWRQMPKASYPTTQTGYESYKGKGTDKDMLGGNYSYTYDNDAPKNCTTEQYKYISTEPSPQLTRGAWARPGTGAWATTTTKVTTLTRPTSDINEAVSYLAGALQQSSLTHATPPQQYYNTLGQPRMEHYGDTIDSGEAQSGYGYMSGQAMGRESYAGIIDSREALRKYGGAAV